MRIEDLRVTTLVYQYPIDKRFTYAGGICSYRTTSLIEIEADNGLVGIGSVYSHPGIVKLIVEDYLRPLLQGEQVDNIRRLWMKMYLATRWFGRKGVAMSAIGGVDVALWDLLGKRQDRPVYDLLGAAKPRSVAAYASALLWKNDISDLTVEAASIRNAGFRRMKVRLGRSEEYDIAAVDAVIAGAGADGQVMVDGSMRYSIDQALSLSEMLHERNVVWFEEPFQPEQIELFSKLTAASKVPIAAGENEFGVQGFDELLRANAVNIVQPDASRCGGISEVFAVAHNAQMQGILVAPHTWSDAVAVMANAHVLASIPNGLTVEVDQTGNPFIDELLQDPLKVNDGFLKLPEKPGLGIELRREIIDQLRLPDGAPMPAGLYSDMEFSEVQRNHGKV